MADGLGDNFAAGFGSNWALPPGFDPNEWLKQMQLLQQPGIRPENVAMPAPAGQQQPGNINLLQRPQVPTPEGTATVRSIGVNLDGQETLLPTVSDAGQIMSPDEAIAAFQRTGQHLGKFDTPANADAAGQAIHQQQTQLYPERTPAEAAAASVRRSVQPPGGRAEGAVTRGIEFPAQFAGAFLKNKANLQKNYPERALHATVGPLRGFVEAGTQSAAERFPLQAMGPDGQMEVSTDYDPRQRAADLGAETALNLTLGAGGAAPAGALTMGAARRRPRGGAGKRPPAGPPAELPPKGHNMPPEELPIERSTGEQLAGTVRPRQFYEPDPQYPLRSMTPEKAIEAAQTGEHIIKRGTQPFVGAPAHVKSPPALRAMRNSVDKLVEEGVTAGGAPWYAEGRKAVGEMAQGDPTRATDIAYGAGIGSRARSPEASVNTLATLYNNRLLGRNTAPGQRPHGVSAEDWADYLKTRQGNYEALGAKLDPYTQNLDPGRPFASTSVNDRWHARAFGYRHKNGKPWDDALSEQQHRFVDAETLQATARANKRGVGGRSDWRVDEIQAAIWKAQRRREDPTVGNASYRELFPERAFQATSEVVPGRDPSVGHLTTLAGGPQGPRDVYSRAVGFPVNEKGYDLFFGGAGALQGGPVKEMTGIYGGDRNIGHVAQPMVGTMGSGAERTLEPASMDLVRGVQMVKDVLHGQAMSAGTLPVPVSPAYKGTAPNVFFETGGQWTPQQIAEITARGAERGVPDVIHYGDRAAMANFGDAPPTKFNPKQTTDLGARLAEATGVPSKAVRGNLISSYDPNRQLLPAWAQGEGSGAVSRLVESQIGKWPAEVLEGLTKDPRTQAYITNLIEQNVKASAAGGGAVRQDLMNLLDIMRKPIEQGGGVPGWFRELQLGEVALPSIAILAPLLPAMGGPGGTAADAVRQEGF